MLKRYPAFRLWNEWKVTIHDISCDSLPDVDEDAEADENEGIEANKPHPKDIELPEVCWPHLYANDSGGLDFVFPVRHESKGYVYMAEVAVSLNDLITDCIGGYKMHDRSQLMLRRQIIRSLYCAIDRLESEPIK